MGFASTGICHEGFGKTPRCLGRVVGCWGCLSSDRHLICLTAPCFVWLITLEQGGMTDRWAAPAWYWVCLLYPVSAGEQWENYCSNSSAKRSLSAPLQAAPGRCCSFFALMWRYLLSPASLSAFHHSESRSCIVLLLPWTAPTQGEN